MGSQMRPGLVTSIRVNPKDCMSVIDVMDVTGLKSDGMSFSSMVSLAFSSLLATCRKNGVIPDRDGFEFTEMVGPYLNQSHKKKVHVSNVLRSMGSDIALPAVEIKPKGGELIAPLPTRAEPTIEQREAGRRLTELLQKKDIADSNPAVIWQASDQREYDELYKIVYPEG
jgi:hypothetical protein